MKTLGFSILMSLALAASSTLAFTSSVSQEAEIKFSHWVQLPPEAAQSEAAARAIIKEQLDHMVGPMANAKLISAPKFDQRVTNVRIEKSRSGRYVARYNYTDTLQIMNGFGPQMQLALPNDPLTIWRTADDNTQSLGLKLNPCTDETYQTEEDFAYFWSPDRDGCTEVLKEGRDYNFATVDLEPVDNTERTYPEYARLADSGGRVHVVYLVGKDEPNRIRNPWNRKGRNDLNAVNFRGLADNLEDMGFVKREWSNNEVRQVVKANVNPLPYVLEFTYDYNGKRAKQMVVQLVFTNAKLTQKIEGFVSFLEYALKNSAVMVFDGHSGIGLDAELPGVRKEITERFNNVMPKDKYQIFFFNSCSSYTYYNLGIFKRKGSSNNLDLVTTGLETAFEGGIKVNTEFLKIFHNWARFGWVTSYQTLAQRIESDNMVGINGDEDNLH